MHPLDETLADPNAANTDRALAILRSLPRPLTGLDIKHLTDWARRKRYERMVAKP